MLPNVFKALAQSDVIVVKITLLNYCIGFQNFPNLVQQKD